MDVKTSQLLGSRLDSLSQDIEITTIVTVPRIQLFDVIIYVLSGVGFWFSFSPLSFSLHIYEEKIKSYMSRPHTENHTSCAAWIRSLKRRIVFNDRKDAADRQYGIWKSHRECHLWELKIRGSHLKRIKISINMTYSTNQGVGQSDNWTFHMSWRADHQSTYNLTSFIEKISCFKGLNSGEM